MSRSSVSSSQQAGSANGSSETVAAGMVVVRGNNPVGRVSYVDPATGMIAVETFPTKPRAKNWYTSKEWRDSGLCAVRPHPPD